MKKISKRYVVFDVETTGLFAEKGDRIIEIGAVAVNGDTMGEEFQSLIFTEKAIRRDARKVHGITAEMLAGQPKPQEVFASFRQFIGESTLVAHNADFDVWFLRYEYWRLKHTLINPYRCTLKLSRKRYPGLPDYKLETVAKHVLGVEVKGGRRHRALDDARLTARIWLAIKNTDAPHVIPAPDTGIPGQAPAGDQSTPRHSGGSRNPVFGKAHEED